MINLLEVIVTSNVWQDDYFGCDAYEYCKENNLRHIVIPANTKVLTTKEEWELECDSIDVIYHKNTYRVDKEQLKLHKIKFLHDPLVTKIKGNKIVKRSFPR